MRVVEGKVYNSKSDGQFIVLKKIDHDNYKVRFLETGFERFTCSSNIKSGSIRDKLKPILYGIGFIGVGEHRSSVYGKTTKPYDVWRGMLARCYGPRTQKNKSYAGCTVAKEWHNFQNFAQWYADNYPSDGKKYQIDKDIKIRGNREYSPEACCFVTPKENSNASVAKPYHLIAPDGKAHKGLNLSDFCKEHGLTRQKIGQVLLGKASHHKGWTAFKEEA